MDLMDYRRKIIANSPHLKSASGAVATFSDGVDLPLKSLLVNIEPVQSGTGDPSPDNVRPISGWNGVKVTRCGKNLWKRVSNSYPVSYNGITYSLNADGSIHVQGTASGQSNNYPIASNGMSIEAGTYTMSVRTTDPNIHFIFGGGNGTAGIAYTDMVNGSKKTFTTNGGTTGHNIIRINSGATVNGDIYIQLEEGSTATPYEPYNGVDVSVDLGQTVYGGTLNPLTGVLTVDRLGVPMQSLTWYRSTSYANPLFYTTITGKASDYRKSACSILRNIGSSTIIAAQGFANQSSDGDFASSNGNVQIFARYDSATTVQAFVTAVTGQTIVYPLANPTTIQLTPHQIRGLYGSNTIFADTGNVALEYWAHP